MSHYPIILYPQPVKEFLKLAAESKSKIPPQPTNLQRNNFVKKSRKDEPSAIACFQLLTAINFFLLLGIIFWFPGLTSIMAVLFGGTCTYTLIATWEKRRFFYHSIPPDAEAQQTMEYEQQLLIYQQATAQFLAARHHHLLQVKAYKENLERTLLKTSLQPSGYSDAPQGASEEKFKGYLEQYFPGKIHVGFKIVIPSHQHAYSADFTYVEKSMGLYIDIEIDEIYYYKTKKPTHCCDDQHDRIRNAFFLRGNWVVIRFAEEQVVCYPKRCCKVIANVVAILTGDRFGMEPFKDVPELPLIKHWTIKEAKKMAKRNYRDKLLNQATPSVQY